MFLIFKVIKQPVPLDFYLTSSTFFWLIYVSRKWNFYFDDKFKIKINISLFL